MRFVRERIAAIEGYVPGEQPTDPNVIKLNTNENPYPPSPRVMETIAGIRPDKLRRYPDPLGQSFRQAAAEVFQVRPEMVICGNGMDDVLNLAVRAFSGPEAGIVYPVPTYTLYAVLAQIQGSPVQEVPFGPDYALPLEELLAADGRLMFLANPNSPSGTFVPKEQVEALARRFRGVLVVDEAYVDFADEDCLDLARRYENVLVCRTLSKGYSLAGLRFGFGVGHPELIAGLMKVKDSYNVDAISIEAATAAIRDADHARRNCERVRAERERLTAELRGLGMVVWPSQANFVLARIQTPPAREVYESLKQRGILVRYFDCPGLADKLRITVGTQAQNDALLGALGEILGREPDARSRS